MLFGNGYNIANTIVYSSLAIIIYFIFYLYFVKFRRIIIDINFIKSTIIFIIIGSILRMFSQSFSSIGGVITKSSNPMNLGFYSYFPNLIIPLGLLFLISFELSLLLNKIFKKKYYFFLQLIGLIFLIPLFVYVLFNLTRPILLFLFIIIIIIASLIIINIFKIIKIKLLTKNINKLVLVSQLTDGIVTILAIFVFKNTFKEEHVLSKLLISINPFLFLFLKIALSLIFIYIADKFIKNKNENNYFKLFVILLGFLTGIRDLLTVSLLI